MAKKRKTNSKQGPCAQQQKLDDIERERTVQDEQLQQARQEAEELKELVHKLRSNIQKDDDKEGKVQQNKIDITLKANVINTARKIVYPKCPYISTHEQLLRCTKMVGGKWAYQANSLEISYHCTRAQLIVPSRRDGMLISSKSGKN